MPKLLFVDTNIYLDFYRIRNDVKTPFLSHLEAIKENLIITDQVEMEFKKNRQSAILEGMQELKAPGKIGVPSVLRQDKFGSSTFSVDLIYGGYQIHTKQFEGVGHERA